MYSVPYSPYLCLPVPTHQRARDEMCLVPRWQYDRKPGGGGGVTERLAGVSPGYIHVSMDITNATRCVCILDFKDLTLFAGHIRWCLVKWVTAVCVF